MLLVCGFSPERRWSRPLLVTGGGFSRGGHMAKLVLSAALTAALLRTCDDYVFYGRYTDAATLMVRDMLRWFGL
jgi:hypothetical protein